MLAWCAATRTTKSGRQVAPAERLTLQQALRGITIDAAFGLNMDHEIGSIVAGKKADFTILEDDPFDLGVERLKDVRVAVPADEQGRVLGGPWAQPGEITGEDGGGGEGHGCCQSSRRIDIMIVLPNRPST